MTAHEQGLLQAIIAAPDEDAPRLIYADWCEENGDPERAEFIRVQCELVRGVGQPALLSRITSWDASQDALRDDEREIHLRQRAHVLLDANRSRWMVPVQFVTSYMHRGFVNMIDCKPEVFLRHGATMLQSYPIERVGLLWPKITDSIIHIRIYHGDIPRGVYQTWQLWWFTQRYDIEEQRRYGCTMVVSEHERHCDPHWLRVQLLRLQSVLYKAVENGELPENQPEYEKEQIRRNRAVAQFQQQFPFLTQ